MERPCVAHRPPVCRRTQRCEETPDQKKTTHLGRFEGEVGTAEYGMVQGSFQAFSMGRKSSRRKSRGRKRPTTRFTAGGNADRTRVFGIFALFLKWYHFRGEGANLGGVNCQKCRKTRKIVGAVIGAVTEKENLLWQPITKSNFPSG